MPRGSLALAVHRGSGVEVEGLDDLTKPEVKKVAMANPEFAPYGLAAKQALERAGLWEPLQPKLVRAESVRQALQFVQTGNAEAGLVGRAIADVPEVRALTVDPGLYDPLIQAVGIVAETDQPEQAEQFIRFLLGDDGQRILARYGFGPPEPDATSTDEGALPGQSAQGRTGDVRSGGVWGAVAEPGAVRGVRVTLADVAVGLARPIQARAVISRTRGSRFSNSPATDQARPPARFVVLQPINTKIVPISQAIDASPNRRTPITKTTSAGSSWGGSPPPTNKRPIP